MAKTVYVLNGPNLNLLGTREPEKYGRSTIADVEKLCRASAKRNGFDLVFRQSNIEGELVNWIQEASKKKAAGIVHQRGRLHDDLGRHSRRPARVETADHRNSHHQYSRSRKLPPQFPDLEGGERPGVRVRHPGL